MYYYLFHLIIKGGILVTFHENDIPIVKKVCCLYTYSNFKTMENVLNDDELSKYNLTEKKIAEILHLAIKFNIVDDDTAYLIRENAIRHSELKSKCKNTKLRKLYDNLFKDRVQDKIDFPNGHAFLDFNISKKCVDANNEIPSNYTQISLF